MYLISYSNNHTKQSHFSYLAKPKKCHGSKCETFNIYWVKESNKENYSLMNHFLVKEYYANIV